MAEIVVKFEDKVVERVVTEKRRISIGRTSDNDIVLDNRGVSRKHAQIEVSDSQTVIIDNESLNGTFVNGRRVQEESLQNEDKITIGKYTLVFNCATTHEATASDFDGTMVLKTKKHSAMVEADDKDRAMSRQAGGGPVLINMDSKHNEALPVGAGVITFGKAAFVNIRVKGFWLSDIQAKLSLENGNYLLSNVGSRKKTLVNGEPIESIVVKNGDLIKVGGSTFRFALG